MMNGIHAVFFDLGGTLFSNLGIPKVMMPVLVEAAERLSVEEGIQLLGPALLQATRVVNTAYRDRPFYTHRDLFMDTGREMVTRLGQTVSEDFVQWFYAAQRGVMVRDLQLRGDCRATLEALRERGLSLSIVSNIDDDFLDPMMVNLGLSDLFDHSTSSESVGSCKPDSGIFQSALDKAGRSPSEVIFVGDSRVHDIQGAGAMGMTTVLITEEGGISQLDDENFESNPDHVIAALSELTPIIDSRRAGMQAS